MLFDTNHFSSKKITEAKPDPAWDDGSAFPEVGSRIEVEPCLDNSIYAPGSAQAFASQESSNSDSTLSESQKQTNTAQTFLEKDIQESTTTETCLPSPNLEAGDSDEEASTLSQHRHLAPPSQLKGTGKEQQISETVSPQSCESSKITDPNSQPSKTLRDSSTAPTPKAITDITLDSSSTGFTNAGTMRNGFVLAQDSLPPPSLEKGYCWLPSPGALSTGKGRPPGQTKQEAWLKKRGLIQKREVLNPAILCEWYKIPITWLDPSESLPATELLENNARQLEIFSILESQRSHFNESSTSKACCPNCEQLLVNPLDGCGICGWSYVEIENSPSNNFSPSKDSPSKKRRRGEGNGYIHWRTITKKGKDYPQAYYHWKEGNKKRSKYIPKHLLGAIQEAEAAKRPVIEILGLLGVETSPLYLLGDNQISPSNNQLLGDISNSPSKDISPSKNSPSNDNLLGDISNSPLYDQLLGDTENSPSNLENSPSNHISPSKIRRKGEGSGSIHWRTITRGGKDYPQAYYHYEIWNGGDRLVKSTKYIPKRLLSQVQLMEVEKAPVREILGVLGVNL